MDIYELRRMNLQRLIDEEFGGTQARFITKTGLNQSEISSILRGIRTIGEKKARHIEREASLPDLWLDQNNANQIIHSNGDNNININGGFHKCVSNNCVENDKKFNNQNIALNIYDAAKYIAEHLPQDYFCVLMPDNSLAADGILKDDILIINPKICPCENDLVFICLEFNTPSMRGIITKLGQDILGQYFIWQNNTAVFLPEKSVIVGVVTGINRQLLDNSTLNTRYDPSWDFQKTLIQGD